MLLLLWLKIKMKKSSNKHETKSNIQDKIDEYLNNGIGIWGLESQRV